MSQLFLSVTDPVTQPKCSSVWRTPQGNFTLRKHLFCLWWGQALVIGWLWSNHTEPHYKTSYLCPSFRGRTESEASANTSCRSSLVHVLGWWCSIFLVSCSHQRWKGICQMVAQDKYDLWSILTTLHRRLLWKHQQPSQTAQRRSFIEFSVLAQHTLAGQV